MFEKDYQFYPTPEKIVSKMIASVNWNNVSSVLEPSAGKGNIVDSVRLHADRKVGRVKIDVIEKDVNLQYILKGKKYHLVCDDFLDFKTYKKYDVILMNPPFAEGQRHLLKAINLIRQGGTVVCLLNAETIRNPNTLEKKKLLRSLEELDAVFDFLGNCFDDSERKTGVEVVMVVVRIESNHTCSIFENIKKSFIEEKEAQGICDLEKTNPIDMLIDRFNLECATGRKLIEEYHAYSRIKFVENTDGYEDRAIYMSVKGDSTDINNFIQATRRKYWKILFQTKEFSKVMTDNTRALYYGKIDEFGDYDFSLFNIRQMQIDLISNISTSIEKTIEDLFDYFSRHHMDAGSSNIHLFDGWKTNKSWKVGKKVVLPYMNAYGTWSGKFEPEYACREKLEDIEKVFNYLNGTMSDTNVFEILKSAKDKHQTKKIVLKYFTITFYKKGTAHIEFTDLDTLSRFNLFAARKKNWLPPSYGQASYESMSDEEKIVVDSFDGKEEYQKAYHAGKLNEFNVSRLLA